MAPEVQWARGPSVAWAEYTRFSEAASRQCGWTAASEPLQLAGRDRAADNRAGLADLGCVPGALLETDASPRCRSRRAGPSGSKAHDALANESRRVLDQGDHLLAGACAIF
jgi:hypothetical protein